MPKRETVFSDARKFRMAEEGIAPATPTGYNSNEQVSPFYKAGRRALLPWNPFSRQTCVGTVGTIFFLVLKK